MGDRADAHDGVVDPDIGGFWDDERENGDEWARGDGAEKLAAGQRHGFESRNP